MRAKLKVQNTRCDQGISELEASYYSISSKRIKCFPLRGKRTSNYTSRSNNGHIGVVGENLFLYQMTCSAWDINVNIVTSIFNAMHKPKAVEVLWIILELYNLKLHQHA